MRVTIHQPQFLPWLGYLDKIDQADLFIALDTVQFKKNEWQNRNRIRTSDGWQWLTVPVLHRFGQSAGEVQINETVSWRMQHLRALEIHYAKAPFRDRYLPELRTIYKDSWTHLSALNMAVLRWMLESYGIHTPIRLASEWDSRVNPTDRLIDLCQAVGAAGYLSGPGGEQYLDQTRFKSAGLQLDIQLFQHPVYQQAYDPFVPSLSAVDLLFCCGPEALERLREGRAGHKLRVASSV